MKIKIQLISDDGEKIFTYKDGEFPEELVKIISLESYEHTTEYHNDSVLEEMVSELIDEWNENGLNNPPIN